MPPKTPWSYIRALLSGVPAAPTPEITAPPSPPFRLLALPPELQKDIIDHLELPTQFILRLTNRHFHTLIPRPNHATLLLAERTEWASCLNLYACMDCLRLRPSSYFSTPMINRSKSRYGIESNKRFCIECGLKCPSLQKRYYPGVEIVVEGYRFVYCRQCRVHNGEVGCIGSGLCKGCHGKLGCDAGCTS